MLCPITLRILEDFWDFWDAHSNADYEDVMEDVEVEIALSSSKVYFPVAKDLLSKVREQAQRQGVSSETVINLWLQERLNNAGQPLAPYSDRNASAG